MGGGGGGRDTVLFVSSLDETPKGQGQKDIKDKKDKKRQKGQKEAKRDKKDKNKNTLRRKRTMKAKK